MDFAVNLIPSTVTVLFIENHANVAELSIAAEIASIPAADNSLLLAEFFFFIIIFLS